MAEVLFVGKPVEPPWNDSSKNLARDVIASMKVHVPVLLTRKGASPVSPRAKVEPILGDSSQGFHPSALEKAKLFARIAVGNEPIVHFFFAPNPVTSTASRTALKLRKKRSVHTICSAPARDANLDAILFADVNVVLSLHTERRLLDAGIEPSRVRRIPPSIPAIPVPTDADRLATRRALGLPHDAFVVVYPGDLEFGRGANTIIEAVASLGNREIVLVMACRTKTDRARKRDVELRGLAKTLGIESTVRWVGETRRIHDLLGAADLVALPTDSLYAKMDYPLVLLEAMSMERPVLVAANTPAEELAAGGAAESVDCDVEPLAASIARLFADPAIARAYGKLGRLRVLAEHSPEPMGARYEALYDSLLVR